MSKASISYLWWIDDVQRKVNLTGSQTLFWLDIWKNKNPKIVIDSGAIQWVKDAGEINKSVKKDVLSADFLVITHAHCDHAWMAPYLVKKWFSGKIIMTELTKLQCKEMWLDYVRLVSNEIEKVKELNAKIWKRLHEAIQVVEHVKIIENSKTKSKKVKNSEGYLVKVLWQKKFDEAYQESIAILKEYWVECESDISSVLNEIPELLFDEDDIDIIYNKIETLELKEEIELQNFHPIASWTDTIILELPKMVKDGFNKTIPVVSHLKWTVTSKLQSLVKKTSKEIKENEQIERENEVLTGKVKLAINFVKWHEENDLSISKFEKEYADVLRENEGELLTKIKALSKVSLMGKNYDIDDLIRIYHDYKYRLPNSSLEYIELEKELEELEIMQEKDIDKHLPELPDRDYENKDIRSLLKSVIVTEKTSVCVWEYAVCIDDIKQFSPQEILSLLNGQKRVYVNKNIVTKLHDSLAFFVTSNLENIKRNSDIEEALYNAFDLVEIYEWNRELYLENYKKEYQKAKKYISGFKKRITKESKYSKDELDYIIDINLDSISKDKTIIHIKRLDDSRFYDILFSENLEVVYYFDSKIRARAKEKLSEYILRLELEKTINLENYTTYQSQLHFIRIYEWKEKLNISSQEYERAKALLTKHSIEGKKDIESFNFFDVQYSYTLKDVENFFKLAHQIDEKFSINDIEIIHITSINDERIFDLPYIYEDPNKIVVIQDWLKDEIRKKLLDGIGDFYRISVLRKKKRAEMLEKFRLYEFFKENYTFLFNLEWYSTASDFLNALLARSAEIREIKEKINKIIFARELKRKLNKWSVQKNKDYAEAKELLCKLKINELSDISKVLKIEHQIPYSIEDIKKAISLLKSVYIDKNQDILESIKLNFFDAWHIEWSVQAVLTLVVSEVDNILIWWAKNQINTSWKRRHKHVNIWFSWDLWRIKDPNLAWTPDVSPFTFDYYQIETTYAGRNHLNKDTAINQFFSSIESASWKMIIPCFSMQRTQEILMILLQRRLDSQEYIDNIKKLVKDKKNQEKELLKKWLQVSEKEAFENAISILEVQINYLKGKIFDFDIILDSPLSEKITEIYISKCWEKYNLLDKKVQKELFWKEIITYVKKTWENADKEENDGRVALADLYTNQRRDKKEIIISASGMCDGWSILPHLKENLQNPNSKIIFVGYCPPNTRGWKIKAGDEFISIDGEAFELKCEVDDVAWFSGHIDEEELLLFLTQNEFKKWAIIALTHWDEKRYELAEKIRTVMDRIWRNVKIIVPKLWDSVMVKI